jgi:hypothetical protein
VDQTARLRAVVGGRVADPTRVSVLALSGSRTYVRPMRERDRSETAELLRRVLVLVEAGRLTADGPAAVAIVRRLEGALIALETQRQWDRRNRA